MVLNIEDSIAITQNYVSESNLPKVLRFLRDKPDQVSGISCEAQDGVYHRFRDQLARLHPTILERMPADATVSVSSRAHDRPATTDEPAATAAIALRETVARCSSACPVDGAERQECPVVAEID